ncbi:MAG: 4-hydroxy-3-methylbut-2-enyl diphosphate reductase [Actinomycetota bacterium]
MVPSLEKVLLARPRGYCAGVERAVEAVEVALSTYGRPVYVRKQIVHNLHVVRALEGMGAVFVEELEEVPPGATVVFSAHGVAPGVYGEAALRGLRVVDATCPLVTKVHAEARKFAAGGYQIILIGHDGHEEVVGTMGEAPESVHLVATPRQADRLDLADPRRVAYLSQTTLSVDETAEVVAVLRSRFPGIQAPLRNDICYATQNRQAAVKALAERSEVILVVGAANSSNSNRLVEVARQAGRPAHLIDDASAIEESWLEGPRVVGVSSGASAPDTLVDGVVRHLKDRGAVEVEELTLVEEGVHFGLPSDLRRDAEAAGEISAS